MSSIALALLAAAGSALAAPPPSDGARASARATRAMEAVQGELSLRDMGLSEGDEPSVAVQTYALAAARGASDGPASGRLQAMVPSPVAGETRSAMADGLIRKLPGEARGLLRYVAGVSVEDAGLAARAKTAWEALNLNFSFHLRPGFNPLQVSRRNPPSGPRVGFGPVLDPKHKSDVFVGVAGQW